MCGIVAVVGRDDDRPALAVDHLREVLERAGLDLGDAHVSSAGLAARLGAVADSLTLLDGRLRELPGVRTLVADRAVTDAAEASCIAMRQRVDDLAVEIEGSDDADLREAANAEIVRLRDALWAIERDRVRTARAVGALAGSGAGRAAVDAMWAVQVALSAIDRLEVRGRDSAGLHLMVRHHGLDLDAPDVAAVVAERTADAAFRSGAVRIADGHLVFVYKAAAEIGELGDNTAAMRAEIAEDGLLARALDAPDARMAVLGHTRWASVGIISEANAHPLDQWEIDRTDGPYVAAALNGDVDNFADLKASHSLDIAPEITTDAKVIPTLVSRRLADGTDLSEAFRQSLATFEGSTAIAAVSAHQPASILLGLRGSGQAVYIGTAPGAHIVASEPYGVVEQAGSYLRMDGETPSDPMNPVGSRGQIVTLDGDVPGVAGMRRWSYDGTELPIDPAELVEAPMTTRDIDRADFPHFFLKEITEAPRSVHATFAGRIVTGQDDLPRVDVDDVLDGEIRRRLESGAIRRVVSIGQGTAAIAALGVARLLDRYLIGTGIAVEATLATELSGFGLRGDMTDTLVIAVSQSGTTTDTNRTVDLCRSRGAVVIGIVNRRGSDLTDKADGVLYTSNGRDVEMSVASTKAFYAQLVAGVLLAVGIAEIAVPDRIEPGDRAALLNGLRRLPDAMRTVIDGRARVAEVAGRHAPSKRYWAIVGNGANRIAAREVRIKLSELCYKAIAEDSTEDKKHIDLSSEPLIVVCAAGLTGSTADDVAKEVAIYRAHKATPIVIATEHESRFDGAVDLITVPAVHPDLDYILSTVVGHLFGYEAALAIDAQAGPLRAARVEVETAVESGGLPASEVDGLRERLRAPAQHFNDMLRSGRLDGHLEGSTAVQISTLFRYATGVTPLEHYQSELGKIGTPAVAVEDLARALSAGIDELTRPVDAIKHQAKTVTVGISRADEALLQMPLVRAALDAGAPRDRLTYGNLRLLAALDPAVESVTGFTRYRVEGDVDDGATAQVIDRGGIGRELRSRTADDPRLRGTKHRAASERVVTVSRGRGDGRTTVIVPETKDGATTGITLLHCGFVDRLPVSMMKSVLEGYRGRYQAIEDAVTEIDPNFRDDLLGDLPVIDLLTLPVYVLAEHWTQP